MRECHFSLIITIAVFDGVRLAEGVSGGVDVLLSLPGHISSVRCLATSTSCLSAHNTHCATSQPVQLIFSAGGRAQLKCWRIHASEKIRNLAECSQKTQSKPFESNPASDDETKSESSRTGSASVWHEHLFTYLLHHKGLKRAKPWKVAKYDSDPETRYMDLSALRLDELTEDTRHGHLHIVAAACSDPFVR